MPETIKVNRPSPKVIKVDKPSSNVIKVDRPSPQQKGDHFDALGKAQTIQQGQNPVEAFLGRTRSNLMRSAVMPGKALFGDVPFVRKILPEEVREMTPQTGLQKAAFVIPKLARDFGAASKISALKGLPFLGAAGAFGAATAGTEDPKGIAKEALKEAALFGGIKVGAKFIPKVVGKSFEFAFNRLPKPVQERFMRAGQSIGFGIKNIPGFNNLKFKRHADILTNKVKTEQLARDLETNLKPDELEALTIFIEKKIPRKLVESKPEILNILAQSDKRKVLSTWAGKLKNFYDDGHSKIVEIYGDDFPYIKNYVNRLWDVPKNKEAKVVNWFMTKTKHAKPRLIETIKAGMDVHGLTPKTLNAAELVRYYGSNVYTSMANIQFVRSIKNLRAPDKMKMLMRADKAPAEWPTINHPALNKGMFVGKGKDIPIIKKMPVKVHPDIEQEMKTIFGAVDDSTLLRAVDGVNAFAKQSQLTLSLFHHVALAESALATGLNPAKILLRSVKAMKQGRKPILDLPAAQDGIKHGLSVGAPTDVHRNLIESSLQGAEDFLTKSFPGKIAAKGIVTPVKKFIGANNKFLWDYYHPTMKVMAYEKLVQDALKMPKFAGLPATAAKREVAQFVNDSFGGQSWELMVKSPQWQKNMQRFLLSPDWTLSTARQALAPFGFGARDGVTKELRKELGEKFWRNGMLVLYSGFNNLNRSFSKFYLGEERNLWENDPGSKTRLFLGFNKDGTKKYARMGKQFRELPEFFENPVRKVSGKLSPVVQLAREQISPYKYGAIEKAKGTKRENVERVKQVAKSFLPFSVQSQIAKGEFSPTNFMIPTSRGMTYYKSREMFKQAIKDDNIPLMREIAKAAAENGLDPKALIKRAQSDVEYEEQGGYDAAMDIWVQLQNIPEEQWQGFIESKGIKPRTRKMLRNIIRQKRKAGRTLDLMKEGKFNIERFIKNKR